MEEREREGERREREMVLIVPFLKMPHNFKSTSFAISKDSEAIGECYWVLTIFDTSGIEKS